MTPPCAIPPESGLPLLFYSAFGLTISSSFPLPELPAVASAARSDVRIREATIPACPEPGAASVGLCEVTENRFVLRLDNIARYAAVNGEEIGIDAAPGAEPDSVRLFLLNTVFGALLHQRHLRPLHGSAVQTAAGEAMALVGPSGSGKSSLAAALHARGFGVIADDICAISCRGNEARIFPAFPRLLLHSGVMRQLGFSAMARLARPGVDKRHVVLNTGFVSRPVALRRIYILEPARQGRTAFHEATGAEAIRAVIANTVLRLALARMSSPAEHFATAADIVRSVRVKRLERSPGQALEETADLLARDSER